MESTYLVLFFIIRTHATACFFQSIPKFQVLISRFVGKVQTKMNDKIKCDGDDEWNGLLGWVMMHQNPFISQKKGNKINLFIGNYLPAFNRIKEMYFLIKFCTQWTEVFTMKITRIEIAQIKHLNVFWYAGCPNVTIAFRWAYKIRRNNKNSRIQWNWFQQRFPFTVHKDFSLFRFRIGQWVLWSMWKNYKLMKSSCG